jgi:hypothetical protein
VQKSAKRNQLCKRHSTVALPTAQWLCQQHSGFANSSSDFANSTVALPTAQWLCQQQQWLCQQQQWLCQQQQWLCQQQQWLLQETATPRAIASLDSTAMAYGT